MNKTGFIKELSKKVNLSEDECYRINDILEDNFIFGKSNKEKIINTIKEKLGFSDEVANKIYDAVMEIASSSIKNKILHPFKGND